MNAGEVMPAVTPFNAPPEPSGFVLMVSGLMTMGIYFLATRKKRRKAIEIQESREQSISMSPSDDEFRETELAIEQDLASIQGIVKELHVPPETKKVSDNRIAAKREQFAEQE